MIMHILPDSPIPPGGHSLPPLPYSYDALEPYISAEGLRIHHDSLHRGYVERLNRTELYLVQARISMAFQNLEQLQRDLAFNGAGHTLHSVFWTNLSPYGGGEPRGLVAAHIDSYFDSFEAFKRQLSETARQVKGSGWAALTWQPQWRRLEIQMIKDHEKGTQWGGIPILVLDVWEHAYYLEYRDRRRDYIENLWALINWDDVERRLMLAVNAGLPLTS